MGLFLVEKEEKARFWFFRRVEKVEIFILEGRVI